MDILNKFGQRIKELRNKQGLSQEALAFKANIDRTYMTGVETGKRNISLRNIQKIIIALDVSFEEFFKNIQRDNIEEND